MWNMPKSFTDQFLVDKELFDRTDALDIILDIDTNYFLDPVLLRTCTIPEFRNATMKTETFFSNILTLMKHSVHEGDMFWKKADKMLSFKEIKGTCLGYSNSGTNGNAIGKELRRNILNTIKDLQKAGDVDPVIFELLGVFQEKVGCDRVSDLLTFILKDEIMQYNYRISKELNLSKEENQLCINPYNGTYILLLPKQLLTPLPIAEDFADIEFSCSENERVRREINEYFDLGGRSKLQKSEIEYLLKNKLDYRTELTKTYKKATGKVYDFEKDPLGEIIWYYMSREQVNRYPMQLKQPQSIDEMMEVANKICERFKDLIENNGLWKLLYDEGKPKHESAAQLLFYGIADAYCVANDIDISREVNNGHGPVDFKLSLGDQL